MRTFWYLFCYKKFQGAGKEKYLIWDAADLMINTSCPF